MKIVHVTEALGGGVFSYIYQLANAQVKLGYEVALVYSRRPETPADLTAYFSPEVTLFELPMVREVAPGADFRAMVRLWRLLKKLQGDVIHLHSSKAGILGRFAAALPGVHGKVFYSPHGLAFLRMDVSARKRTLFRLFEKIGALFGGVVVASSRSEFDYIKQGIPRAKTTLIENGIDFSALPAKATANAMPVQVVTINRISPQKDPALFARVAAAIPHTELAFSWIGGGDEEGARLLEASGVAVYGWLPLAEALQRLAQCDIFLQTSRWEGMPIILIQAQAMGIPAVVTDVVGNRDVVKHGVTGFVCADEAELISRIKQLLADPALRESMGRNAYQHARQHFSIERMCNDLLTLYAAS